MSRWGSSQTTALSADQDQGSGDQDQGHEDRMAGEQDLGPKTQGS